ncbi:MAG: hypothetical protein ACI934_001379 [Pseudohongiellaceae bacterium]|jgi:uncharacterized protein (TIGR02001 family)
MQIFKSALLKFVSLVFFSNTNVLAAEINNTITLTSDYLFDGASQTDSGPALQFSSTISLKSGFYAGIWASNVDFSPTYPSEIEIDYILGYGRTLNENAYLDLGAAHYTYSTIPSPGYDFTELYANYIFKNRTTFSLYLADNTAALNGFAYRFKVSHLEPLRNNYSLALEATYIDQKDNNFSWFHYKLGIVKTLDSFQWNLSYQNTNIGNNSDPYNRADGRVVMGLVYSF